jgi:hypothetical protein
MTVTEYEIAVAGPIGPVTRSCLPGFTSAMLPPTTVLAGTVASTDKLLKVIDLLTTHGAAPIEIWITRDQSGTSGADQADVRAMSPLRATTNSPSSRP